MRSGRHREVLGVELRDCRVCGRATEQTLGVSKPTRRVRFLPHRVEEIDLVERHWAKCSVCSYSFTLSD